MSTQPRPAQMSYRLSRKQFPYPSNSNDLAHNFKLRAIMRISEKGMYRLTVVLSVPKLP